MSVRKDLRLLMGADFRLQMICLQFSRPGARLAGCSSLPSTFQLLGRKKNAAISGKCRNTRSPLGLN